MADVHDVAAAVLERLGSSTTAMKLQKLVYYCQAWHLAWEGEPLFDARIEAWANGPVVPELYKVHRGRFRVDNWPKGNPDALESNEQETIDAVVEFYGDKTPVWLSELTHQERPWRAARESAGLAPGDRGQVPIDLEEMLDYYGGLIGA